MLEVWETRSSGEKSLTGLEQKKIFSIFYSRNALYRSNKNDWRAEWGYQALFSCCTSKKAGVAILFNNNFTFQISKTYFDPEGRFIICDLTVNGKQLTLTNIYAPNNDDSNFFTFQSIIWLISSATRS